MSSIALHHELIEAGSFHFDHVMGFDEAVTYSVHDGNVRIGSPDYTLVFEQWPTGPAHFLIGDQMVDVEEALVYEMTEALPLANHDLNGLILAALRQRPTELTQVRIDELEQLQAVL